MKTFIALLAKPAAVFMLLVMIIGSAVGQTTKQQKETKKLADIKALVTSQNFIFKAEYANPMRGGNRYLTSDYDFKIAKDSLIAYLPYFGRAFVAPINPDDAGMMFTATHFEYKIVEKKNGWDVSIKPKDAKDVNSMYLSIGKDGYATLQITSTNRDAISYQGYIEAKKQKV